MAHILVIDDEQQLCNAIRQFLEHDGHRVTLAANGDEGLERYRSGRPDLIITDVLMPGKDGVEVLAEIRRRDHDTPIIAISGGRRSLTTAFNLDSTSLVGANRTLAKPFTRAQLQEAVRACLG